MKEAAHSTGSNAHSELTLSIFFASIILGLSVSATFLIRAFLCIATFELEVRKSIAAHAASCLGLLALVGAYHTGRDMAKRDAGTSSFEVCPAKSKP